MQITSKTGNAGREIERQRDLDIAKGIGIILVVWAHINGPFRVYIEQWHMPFFFFISGMLYKNRNISIKDYLLRKCKSLLLPFWWWNLLFFPLFFVLYYWKNWSPEIFFRWLTAIVFTLDKVPFLGATWFLPALFWVSVAMHMMIKLSGNFKYSDICLLGAGLLACILGFYISFPYRYSRTLICMLFYICGYLYQKYLRNNVRNGIIVIFILVSGAICVITANGYFVSLGDMEGHYEVIIIVIFIIRALAYIFLALRLSVWLSECAFVDKISSHLSFLGRKSMCIVIWHFLAFRVAIILQIIVTGAAVQSIAAFPVYDSSGIWCIIYLITGVYVSLGWQYILEHNPFTAIIRKVYMI